MSELDAQSQKLGLRGVLEVYTTSARMVGTANATGAIAGGVAFNALGQNTLLQGSIKVAIGLFLAGILAFTISYVALMIGTIQMDNYFMASKDLSDWEKVIWPQKKKPNVFLTSARRNIIAGLAMGFLSFVCFLIGLANVFVTVVHL